MAGSEWQVVSIPLSGGQEDNRSPIALDPPSMALVQNGEFVKDGCIRKRRGAVKVRDFTSTAADEMHVAALMQHRDSLRVWNSQGAVGYRDTPSQVALGTELSREPNPGPMPSEITQTPINRQYQVLGCASCALSLSGSNYMMHAWVDDTNDTVWYWVRDAETGSSIGDPTPVQSGATRHLRIINLTTGKFALFWQVGTNVRYVTVAAATGVASAVVTIVAAGTNTGDWDVNIDATAGKVDVLWWDTAANNLRMEEFSTALVSTGRSFTKAFVATDYHSVWVDTAPPSELWVAAIHVTGGVNTLHLNRISKATYTEVASTDNNIGLALLLGVSLVWDGAAEWVAVSGELEEMGPGETQRAGHTRIWRLGTSTIIPATQADVAGHIMVAGGFMPSDQHPEPWWPLAYWHVDTISGRSLYAYGTVVYHRSVSIEDSQGSTTTRTVVLPAGRWGSDTAMVYPATDPSPITARPAPNLPRATSPDGGETWRFDAMVVAALKPDAVVVGSDVFSQYGVAGTSSLRVGVDEVVVRPLPDPHRVAQVTPWGLPLAHGGVVVGHDGMQMHEASIQAQPSRPMKISTAAGATLSGKYRWRACWRWVDNEGCIHRSSPGEATAQHDFSGGAAVGNIVLSLLLPPPTALVGVNRTFLGVELYRQVEALDALYRLVSFTEVTDTTTVTNGNWIHITDSGFFQLASQPLLYTEGGELPNDAVPAALDIVAAGQRVWVLSGEDRTRLYPTKLLAEEGAQLRGPEWSKAQAVRMPEPILALSALDDRPVAFGERGVYVIEGAGPDNLNQGSEFYVRSVTTEFGILDPRSAVRFPGGILFRAPRGVFLFGEDLSLSLLSGGMTDTLDGHRVISSLAVPGRSEVRLYLSETGSGGPQAARAVVFDYLGGRWSYWTNGAGACVVRGGEVERVCINEETGVPGLYREDDDTFTDSVTHWAAGGSDVWSGGYLFWVRTPHIRPSGRDAGHMSVHVAQFAVDSPPDASTRGLFVSWEKDYGANLASREGAVSYLAADVNGAQFLEVTPAGTAGPGLKCCAIQFTFGELPIVPQGEVFGSPDVTPPTAQTVPTSVARLTLELCLHPGLLQGLPSTLRK